jgi:hypothetical protein
MDESLNDFMQAKGSDKVTYSSKKMESLHNNPLMSDSAGLIKSKKRISSEERIPESTKNHDAKFSH